MKRIYKYPLEVIGKQYIELPHGAEILHVDGQCGELKLWAMFEDREYLSPDKHDIRIYGTGQQIPEETGALSYLGTVKQNMDSLVWHIFEMINKEDSHE